MTRFRRLRDVPLRLPPASALVLPDPRSAHKCPAEVWGTTDSALRRVADVEPFGPMREWVGGLGRRVAPTPGAARRLAKPLDLCARIGTAFAVLEIELRRIDGDKSDAVVDSALGFSSFLQTRVGPERFGFYMWRTARVGYYLARVGDRVDPRDLLPTNDEVRIVRNEVMPAYESATAARQLAWDTLIEPCAPVH
jgi:hypothetical protein